MTTPNRYMGAPANLVTAPNGAVVYDKVSPALEQILYTTPVVEKVTEGVWLIGGHSLANCTVIDAPEGLIVFDTGDNADEGAHFRSIIEAHISKRPICAIIYSHSHYAMGAGAMVDDAGQVMVVGHAQLNATVQTNMQAGGAPAAIPEIGPLLTARALTQLHFQMPKEGADAPLAQGIEFKAPAFLPVTHPVHNGQTLSVAGLEFQFFTEHVSDDYSVTAWVPSLHMALNNFFWPGTPNLYTPRGAVYRDPQDWRDGLKVIRDLQPAILVNTHARTITGKEKVHEAITNYMDLVSLTYDQTLRGILQGLGPDDLRYFVQKPDHLANAYYNAETYGETSWFPPAIYYYQFGWYDREPSKLFKIAPKDEAQRLVALMGGRDAVLRATRESADKKEYAWAAQLVHYAYQCDPLDAEVRQLKADMLRKLGQLSMSSIGRAFLISEARALEGQAQIPRMWLPQPAVIARDPATFVNYFRVRIDPIKAQHTDCVLAFAFAHADRTVALHVRRGVAEYIPTPATYLREADITLTMDGATWASLYLSQVDLAQALDAGQVQLLNCKTREALALWDLFDRFTAAENLTVPSTSH